MPLGAAFEVGAVRIMRIMGIVRCVIEVPRVVIPPLAHQSPEPNQTASGNGDLSKHSQQNIPLFLKRGEGFGGRRKTFFLVKKSFSPPPGSHLLL